MKKPRPRVGIVMGSDSDAPVMEEAARILDTFGVPYEMTVTSAHRSPARTRTIVSQAVRAGVRVFIVGAGAAAHLPGVVAAETPLPVIGVPIDSSSLAGLDALLSIVQMPGGVPVATMAIGKAGAKNAGILAVQILAEGDPELRARLAKFKAGQETEVAQRAARLKKIRERAAGPGR
ncbi:MAG: 5-(carboxyamino)imidazole ribonucleotide mutase [Nitrospirae bacterium RBG_16_64_22]|nr:MAG: 5-(carboxyamino)imidazole ribonucleotide mutase [Nitrospirae bacterium RBG_16_64_22]